MHVYTKCSLSGWNSFIASSLLTRWKINSWGRPTRHSLIWPQPAFPASLSIMQHTLQPPTTSHRSFSHLGKGCLSTFSPCGELSHPSWQYWNVTFMKTSQFHPTSMLPLILDILLLDKTLITIRCHYLFMWFSPSLVSQRFQNKKHA